MKPRKSISKGTRFRIFARDGYSCKYCGRQSDSVVLHVDHIKPVCQGGTNDDENLITSCQDCNLGKGSKDPLQAAPNEETRLRLAQERNEQAAAFEAVKAAKEARDGIRQEIVNFWCSLSGRDSMDRATLAVMVRYLEQFGAETLFSWIESAFRRSDWHSDKKAGMYVSGIRRRVLEDLAAAEQPA